MRKSACNSGYVSLTWESREKLRRKIRLQIYVLAGHQKFKMCQGICSLMIKLYLDIALTTELTFPLLSMKFVETDMQGRKSLLIILLFKPIDKERRQKKLVSGCHWIISANLYREHVSNVRLKHVSSLFTLKFDWEGQRKEMGWGDFPNGMHVSFLSAHGPPWRRQVKCFTSSCLSNLGLVGKTDITSSSFTSPFHFLKNQVN